MFNHQHFRVLNIERKLIIQKRPLQGKTKNVHKNYVKEPLQGKTENVQNKYAKEPLQGRRGTSGSAPQSKEPRGYRRRAQTVDFDDQILI